MIPSHHIRGKKKRWAVALNRDTLQRTTQERRRKHETEGEIIAPSHLPPTLRALTFSGFVPSPPIRPAPFRPPPSAIFFLAVSFFLLSPFFFRECDENESQLNIPHHQYQSTLLHVRGCSTTDETKQLRRWLAQHIRDVLSLRNCQNSQAICSLERPPSTNLASERDPSPTSSG